MADMHTSPVSRRCIHALGAVALAAYMVMSLLSWVQTPALWHDSVVPGTKAFFAGLADALQPSFPLASAWLVENRLFGGPGAVIASYWVTLAIATGAGVWLLLGLTRGREEPHPKMPALLLRWSASFAAACVLAFPVFTQDFWLSVVWGRMIAAGQNPYYGVFTPEALSGLPLDHFPMPMSYGPLWGLVSAAVCYVAGGSLLAVAALFKLLLAAAWLGSLYLADRIVMHQPVRRRCIAIVTLGWLPCGVTQTVAEGHNDIAMVVFALLWLHLLLEGRKAAPVALAASVLCKYVTAPLFLVDIVHVLRRGRERWPQYVWRMVIPSVLILAIGGVFYRSLAFFDGVLLVGAWRFLQPQDAVRVLELTLGIPSAALGIAAAAVIPATAAYQLGLAWKDATRDNLLKSAIAVMSAVLFAGVSHVWAWYVVWVLALAVLAPGWWLSRFIVGIAIMAPFTLAAWWVEPFEHHTEFAALAMYGCAIAWAWATRRDADAMRLARDQHAHVSTPSIGSVAGG